MGAKQDRAVMEAALYAADHPLSMEEIQQILNTSSETYVRKLIDELKADYAKRGGPLSLVEVGKGTFTIRLEDKYMPRLDKVISKTTLSRGGIKTLAMIAYKQNLTQAKLAEFRGSRVYDHVRQLLALGFIESKPFGRTRMLRISRRGASYFGFEDDIDLIRERIEELAR